MLFWSIREISDIGHQREQWIRRDAEPWECWDECFELFFDACPNEGDFPQLTAEERDIVLPLFEAMCAFEVPENWDGDDTRILSNPKWIEIAELAGAVRQSLLGLLTDREELRGLRDGYDHETSEPKRHYIRLKPD